LSVVFRQLPFDADLDIYRWNRPPMRVFGPTLMIRGEDDATDASGG
jgi:hypothetical protein